MRTRRSRGDGRTADSGASGAAVRAAGLSAALVTLAWPSIRRAARRDRRHHVAEAQRLGVAAVSGAAVQQALLSVAVAVIVAVGLILTPLFLYLVLSDD
jgi:hypothetical protein